jgi:outer membrane protein assembly factor BamA
LLSLHRAADRVDVSGIGRLRRVALVCAAACLVRPAIAHAQADPATFANYEGRRVTGIRIEGHRVTREHVITRELETRAGEPFALTVLEADLQRLENLGLFSETRVVPEADGDGVRLGVTVKEMPPILAFPSFIYTEENGFSYGAAVSALNLTGRGMSLSARAYFGGTTQRWGKFSNPWIRGNHLSFEFFGGKRDRADILNGFEEDSWEFSPRLGTWLGKHGRLQGSVSLFQMRSDVGGKTLGADREDHFLRVGVVLGYDTRDSWRDPRHGWKSELEIIRSGGAGSFWTMNLDGRRYQPIGPRQHVLLSTLVTLQSGTVGGDVPGYFTYYLGGANTIRGYGVEDLQELSGKNQLLTTAEYNVSLLPLARRDFWRWSYSIGVQLALFTDLGVAWSEGSEFSAERFRGGAGAGLRFLVPGSEQVRFDLGWSEAGGLHFHFASGTKPSNQRQRLR